MRKVKPPRAAAAETVAVVAEVLCISLLFCSPVFFPITATPDYAHTVYLKAESAWQKRHACCRPAIGNESFALVKFVDDDDDDDGQCAQCKEKERRKEKEREHVTRVGCAWMED